MTTWHRRSAALALAAALCGAPLFAADVEKKTTPSFGVLQAPAPEAAKAQALEWLKTAGPMDGDRQQAFDAAWAADAPLLDKVTDTIALGNPDAAKLLAEARDATAAAPQEAPALLRDDKQGPFFRANFALAYAKALSDRKVHEQALEALKAVKPDQTVDPAAYFFVKAVSEHALLQKDAALEDIDHLLSDVADSPERYRTVGILMAFDMQQWKEKGLDDIARRMNAVKDRLEILRGGEKTQKMEKDVVFRLDEIIKELENQRKNGGKSNGGNCPPGGDKDGDKPNDTVQSSRPAPDSMIIGGAGAGKIDMKKLNDVATKWGKLPEKDRAEAMKDLTRDLPPEQRATVEKFFEQLAKRGEGRNR
jgi:hypothetical protein